METLGILSGFTGGIINIVLDQTLQAVKTAIYCRRKLNSLESQLQRITPLAASAQCEFRLVSQWQHQHSDGRQRDAVKQWLQRLESLLNDANTMVNCCTIPNCNPCMRYQIGKRIERVAKGIKEHLDDVGVVNLAQLLLAENDVLRSIHGLGRTVGRHQSMDIARVEPLYEPCIIGQEGLFWELQDRILSAVETDEDSCIGITGMGGSGKSLLLKTVINSEAVQSSFANDLIIRLTVSQRPFPSLLRKLVRSIAKQTMTMAPTEDVQGFVQGSLRQRRFLLALDDLWEGDENLLEMLLIPRKKNSRIVVTSRDQRLLSRIRMKSIISIRELTQEEAWELFKVHAFPEDVPFPSELESVARQVALECKGLPLAIKVVGAAMVERVHEPEWDIALEKLRNAEILNRQQEDLLFGRLRLSFDVLSSILRACFLYFAAYKEDAVIDVEEVIFFWNYEGLLGTSNGHRWLQHGRELLNSLVDRCLIDAVSTDRNGQLKSCKMHDVLRDLALQIARQEEGCFFRSGRRLTRFPSETCSENFQRISLKDNNITNIQEDFRGSTVRTLLLSGNRGLEELPENVIGRLTEIRILDLRKTAVQLLPDSIGFLKQLVCLRMSGTPIERLPDRAMRSLKKLQVLDLAECVRLTELPERLSKLRSLQILDLHGCRSLGYLPLGITALVSLQVLNMDNCFASVWPMQFKPPTTMVGKISSSWRGIRPPHLTDLTALTELRRLEIDNWSDTSIPSGTMTCFPHLQKLVLGMHSIQTLPDDMISIEGLGQLKLKCGSMSELPSWMTQLTSLRELNLFQCRSLEILPDLDRLQLLGSLEIHECDMLEGLPARFGRSESFRSLKVLWLRKLNKLQGLPPLQAGAMRALEVLGIEKCLHVRRLPQGLRKLCNLKILSIYGSTELIRATSQDGEDWERANRLQREKGVKLLRERNAEWMNAVGGNFGED